MCGNGRRRNHVSTTADVPLLLKMLVCRGAVHSSRRLRLIFTTLQIAPGSATKTSSFPRSASGSLVIDSSFFSAQPLCPLCLCGKCPYHAESPKTQRLRREEPSSHARKTTVHMQISLGCLSPAGVSRPVIRTNK